MILNSRMCLTSFTTHKLIKFTTEKLIEIFYKCQVHLYANKENN